MSELRGGVMRSPRHRWILIAAIATCGASGSACGTSVSDGGAGSGGAGGSAGGSPESASTTGDSHPCSTEVSDACRAWIVAECEGLSEEECRAYPFHPLDEGTAVGCALAGRVSEAQCSQPAEPYRCVAGKDVGDGGYPLGFEGVDVYYMVPVDDSVPFSPGVHLTLAMCGSPGSPDLCDCSGTP